jgi:hypothetical protein
VRAIVLASITLAWASAAHAQPPCVPLPVAVHVEPWTASLSWPAGATPSPYFVEYSAGKFPTQLDVSAAPGSMTAEATVTNLAPGGTYAVAVCEPRIVGGCPATDPARGCTTVVTVVVPSAYAGVVMNDPGRAACETEAGVAYAGDGLGGPTTAAVRTASAQGCCEACAAVGPHLPYSDACRFFVWDARSGVCALESNRRGATAADGRVSGRVVAWPRATSTTRPRGNP